jgi:hypothetical protein
MESSGGQHKLEYQGYLKGMLLLPYSISNPK